MPDRLELKMSFEDDGTAELFAHVEANGFRGRGSAWINPDQLVELSSKLGRAFPLQEVLEISGGYWSQSEPGTLSQEHLAIAFYPVAGRGVVGCQVRLASPMQTDDRPQVRHAVQAELLTSYEELQRFAAALGALAAGQVEEATLHAVEI